MSKRILPNHIPGAIHDWRALKRHEAQIVEQAIQNLLMGAAYTPMEPCVLDVLKIVKNWRHQLSVKEWGR